MSSTAYGCLPGTSIRDVEGNTLKSRDAFRDICWPHVARILGCGPLHQLEGNTDEFSVTLDVNHGVDAIALRNDGSIMLLSTRVQVCIEPWDTFTVRYVGRGMKDDPEMSKLVAAAEGRGGVHPDWTVQCYLGSLNGPLLSAGCVRTIDLARCARDLKPCPVCRMSSDASLLCWSWASMRMYGIEVKEFHPEPKETL